MIKYNIKRTAHTSLDDIDWSQIDGMDLLNNANASAATYQTIAQLAYNDDAMFFRFRCTDDTINCVMSGYNQPIYDEETVEFFFSSGGDISRYLELEWNGIGGVFCANVTNDMAGSTTLDFVQDNIMTSVITPTEYGWELTGVIPKQLFAGEFAGEWKFNAYRIKRHNDNSMILMAYSPTYEEAFHRPLKFATLIFD